MGLGGGGAIRSSKVYLIMRVRLSVCRLKGEVKRRGIKDKQGGHTWGNKVVSWGELTWVLEEETLEADT